jgi:hypothetical protein
VNVPRGSGKDVATGKSDRRIVQTFVTVDENGRLWLTAGMAVRFVAFVE